MARIRLVMRPSVLNQPVPVVTQMVNSWLSERGYEPVDERTIRRDIDRALELHHERIVGGAVWYRAQFQALYADIWQSLDVTPRGKERAPLYADAIRVLEDMARIDGVWTRVGTPAEDPSAVFDGEIVDAQSLYEQGQIGEDELRAYLLVLHRETGGYSQAPAAQVIDSQAQALPEPPKPAPGRVLAPRGSREDSGPKGPIPGIGPMGDELPMDPMAEWPPEDE